MEATGVGGVIAEMSDLLDGAVDAFDSEAVGNAVGFEDATKRASPGRLWNRLVCKREENNRKIPQWPCQPGDERGW
jgi:hypothetical protein